MLTSTANQQTIRVLRQKWGLAAFCGLALWLRFFFWLKTWWQPPYPTRWLLVSGLALVYLLAVVWRGLKDNHRHDENELLSTFGWGNIFSLLRGFILVLFCGFLFSPWPGDNWYAWLPGLLYTSAALPDFIDGVAARLTNHVTKLGETLDISIDSLGVLGVSLLSVSYGQVPWWYLSVGLARYFFLAGIWLRRKLDLPVYELPFSQRRRGFAALAMGLFFVILYPVFSPPGTYLAAFVFAVYILGGFLWDWGVTIGWIPAQPGKRYLNVQNFIVRFLPIFLRMVLFVCGLVILMPKVWIRGDSPLWWAEAGLALCVILGIAGRICAIAALVILGIQQVAAPLDVIQLSLIFLYSNLLFLGTGAFSLWPIEDRLIYSRIGDTR